MTQSQYTKKIRAAPAAHYKTTCGLLVLCLYAIEANAWEQITCKLPKNKGLKKHWLHAEYKPVIDPVSIPDGSPQHAALLAAIEQMNLNPSNFRYHYGGMDNSDGVGVANGESEIWMQDLGADHQFVSAIEQSDSDYSSSCTATESDIIINTHYRPAREPVGINKINFNTDKQQMFEYGGSHGVFHSIAMHEMGHAAGLQHEGDVLNLMGGDYLVVAQGDSVYPYIGEDAASGLIALYGVSTTALEDVSVSHWRHGDKREIGDGSFFSVHHRTGIFSSDTVELAKTCAYHKPNLSGALITACPEPVYQVAKGQTVKLELSYENAGRTKVLQIVANYYLSTDNIIDSQDTLLKSKTLRIKQDSQPATLTTDVTLPSNLNSGKNYWLGCIVDADNALNESVETNNATYVGIAIK
jgi:CARDB